MSEPRAVYCGDLRCEGLVPDSVVCCGSCHDDDEEGYASLCGGRMRDGCEAYVCCTVALWLRERGLLPS